MTGRPAFAPAYLSAAAQPLIVRRSVRLRLLTGDY